MDDLYIRGHFTDREEEFEKRKGELISKRDAVKQKIDQFDTATDDWQDKANQVYSFAKNAKYWFQNGERRTRLQILKSLGTKGILRDKKIILELDAPFITIQNTQKEIKSKFPSFEPEKMAEFTHDLRQQPLVAAVKTTWLRMLDEIRTFFRANPDDEF